MEQEFIRALDEYFCAHYSDYVRLSAIEGYVMPDVLYVADDGNIFKAGLADTSFTFSFYFRSLRDKLHDLREKNTFAKLLPKVLAHVSETAESAGKLLEIDPQFWNLLVKGKVYPEKNTVLALALVCRLQLTDVQNLLIVSGFTFRDDDVRDVVVRYLIEQQIFNPVMRDRCLAEYKIDCLPIRREIA